MNLYNQIKYNGYRINIYYDDDARSPREAYDNLGTLYTAHRRYRPEKEFDDHFDIDKVFEGHIGSFPVRLSLSMAILWSDSAYPSCICTVKTSSTSSMDKRFARLQPE